MKPISLNTFSQKFVFLLLLSFLLISVPAASGDYELTWSTIGGGGRSAGGNYSLSCIIGRPEAGVMSGGDYELVGGFLPSPTNNPPQANAGGDQTAFVGTECTAEVTLDGSDSNDADGDELTYCWSWTIGGEICDAEGESPVIQLPLGEHTIELVVNDGMEDSEPDYVEITVEDGTPPVITCPADVTVECDQLTDPANTGTATAVDNCDDSPMITYSDSVSGSCPMIISRTWTATDESDNAGFCVQTITVQDTTGPVITCPADVVLECPADTSVEANGSAAAIDNCDDSPVITYDDSFAPGFGNTGVIERTWTATDDCGNTSSCVQSITVVDTTAPELSVSVEPGVLWPPNHKMVEVFAAVIVSDGCDGDVDWTVSVTSNEDDNGKGDGNTSGDIEVTDAGRIFLRAERSGKGDGRVYTITYEAEDASGNTSEATATVIVPHNQP